MARQVPEWQGATDVVAIPSRVKLRVLDRQRNICAGPACCRSFSATARPEFDHIVPLILGGAHAERNLQALCGDCHSAKSAVDVRIKAKVARVKAKALGLKPPSRNPLPGGRGSALKRKISGGTVRRFEE